MLLSLAYAWMAVLKKSEIRTLGVATTPFFGLSLLSSSFSLPISSYLFLMFESSYFVSAWFAWHLLLGLWLSHHFVFTSCIQFFSFCSHLFAMVLSILGLHLVLVTSRLWHCVTRVTWSESLQGTCSWNMPTMGEITRYLTCDVITWSSDPTVLLTTSDYLWLPEIVTNRTTSQAMRTDWQCRPPERSHELDSQRNHTNQLKSRPYFLTTSLYLKCWEVRSDFQVPCVTIGTSLSLPFSAPPRPLSKPRGACGKICALPRTGESCDKT